MAKAQNHRQNHQLTQQSYYTNTSFLPLLCRASIKDVNIKNLKDHPSSSSPSSSFSDDPSSPKVSCIGQIKRNNKLIIPFSTTPYRLTASSSSAAEAHHISTQTHGPVKYTKLKKWFSGKNLTMNPPPTTAGSAASAACGDGSCRSGGREMKNYGSSRRSSKINDDDGHKYHVRVNVNELDPPLPVVKKPPQQPPEVNLWSRRSGGLALKSLQIQHHIHLPNQPAPTV